MASSEITPVAQKIDRLIKRVEDGDIKIPAFQRGFVWKQEQVIDLLDSIRLDYPIGSILLWNSNEKLQSTRNIAGFPLPDRDESYPVNYVIDGQQRLSSIYAVFSSHSTQDKSTQDYNPDTKIFDIYFDFETDSLLTLVEYESLQNNSGAILLRNLLDTSAFLDQLQNLHKNYHKQAKDLYSKFSNYEVPVVNIRREKEEVGIIFERINNTGTKMNMVDIMVAWTWSDNFQLKDAISDLLETLDDRGFGTLPTKVILQSISGIIQDNTKSKEILKLEPHIIRENFSMVEKSLLKVVDFLSSEFNCLNSDFLPHVQQVVGLAKFFSRHIAPDAEQIDKVKIWFWRTSFSRRYTAQTDDKMNADMALMNSLHRKEYELLDEYSYSIDSRTLISTKFSKSQPYVRALLLLMAGRYPLDLVKGTKNDVGESLSEFNRKQYHHIFPKAFLKNRGTHNDKINSMVNFCFLPADSNRKISNKAPSDYFFNVVPQEKYQKALQSNLIPVNRDVYMKENYEQFLEKRATLIMQAVDQLTLLG